jgi:hypothetical protein
MAVTPNIGLKETRSIALVGIERFPKRSKAPQLPARGVRALDLTADGTALLVGLPTGLARVDLGSCRS